MFRSLRHLGWIFSILLHLAVLLGSAYISTSQHIKIDLNKKMYEVTLVGPPNKGLAGAKGAPKPKAQPQATPQKPEVKEAPAKVESVEQKKPEKKVPAMDSAQAIPKETANATIAKVEEPKKEAPKETPPKVEEPKEKTPEKPKVEEPKKTTPEKPKAEDKKEPAKKEPSKEDVLAQALKDAGQAATSKSTQAPAGQGSGNAVADALASLSSTGRGRGSAGSGTAEDGPGTGESAGTLAEYYGTQVKDAIRPNWRYPRVSAAVLVTTVELRVNQAGEILAARVVNSSGRHDYDASVMRAIEETKKLPRLPETLSATLIINFNSMDL